MNKIKDPTLICVYCGEMMKSLTKEQIKIFGKPSCCGFDMLVIDKSKIYSIIKGLDVLKNNLEKDSLNGLI